MTFQYDPTVPNPPNDPSDDVSVMQINAASISGWVAVDHSGFNVSEGGTHKQITFSSNNTPSLPTTFPIAFTQDPSDFGGTPTEAQLFFFPEGSDTPEATDQYILTGKGSTYLFGGIIIKWGQAVIANGASTKAVVLATDSSDFPNNCFAVQVTPFSGSSGLVAGNYPGVTGVSNAGFTITRNANGTALTYFYVAIGN